MKLKYLNGFIKYRNIQKKNWIGTLAYKLVLNDGIIKYVGEIMIH